jgi:hypothetical protein
VVALRVYSGFVELRALMYVTLATRRSSIKETGFEKSNALDIEDIQTFGLIGD